VSTPARRRVQGDGDTRRLCDVGEAREAVYARAGCFVDNADRASFAVHDHNGAVRALVDEVEGVGDGVTAGQHQRGVPHRVPALDPGDDVGDRRAVDVLGEHDQAAAPRDRLGHATPGDGGHVRHDDRDGRAGAVRGGQVDVEAGLHVRTVRQQEHVVVGEVVGRLVAFEETHESPGYVPDPAAANAAGPVAGSEA